MALSGGGYQYAIHGVTTGKRCYATWITGAVAGHPQIGSMVSDRPIDGSSGACGLMGVRNGGIGDDSNFTCNDRAIGATQVSSSTLSLPRHVGSCYSYSTAHNTVTRVKN
jgi:hypothetical protein